MQPLPMLPCWHIKQRLPLLPLPPTDRITCVGVYEQLVDNTWQALAFFSSNFRDGERKYIMFDRELLALYLAIRHFRFMLEGRKFTAYEDHKPLTFTKAAKPWSARQQCHLSAISEFTTDIWHVAGKDNLLADCLSRAQVSSVDLGIDCTTMVADQRADGDIQVFWLSATGLCLEDMPFQDSDTTLFCDVLTGRVRPMVPAS